MSHLRWLGPALLAGVVGIAVALGAWKQSAIADADAAAASQPEPKESVSVAVAREREHSASSTSIGTVVALRSITVRNEIAGTVRQASLLPGQIVDAGTLLVGLDVSVEEAELKALQARAELASTQLARTQRMQQQRAASEMEFDTARAERDIAFAQVARTQAVIDRKTIRAPFRGRVGISDVHPGQYLNEGTLITTLQGVADHAYVDFAVAQHVAARLRTGDNVAVFAAAESALPATIVALDARVDPATRNATVRAKIADADNVLTPGASVRVQVPIGEPRLAIAIPASAVRKGPDGDHVFVLLTDASGNLRAHTRLVRIDATAGDEVLIEGGLLAGERVAASGSFKLRDSSLVTVVGNVDTPQSTAPGAEVAAL